MSPSSLWGVTPRQSIELECARRGRDALIDGCIALLEGRDSEVDDGLVMALAGPTGHRVLTGESRADGAMWKRVWGTRGLLWAWEPRATAALDIGLADEAWRVREMAAKVARRHLVGDLIPRLVALQNDPVKRVRLVANDAVRQITDARA
jgi:hypothetical protein